MKTSRVTTWVARFLRHRFARFGLVGASGAVVNLGILWLLSDYGQLSVEVASAWAIELSCLSNFFLNNWLTFGDLNAQARHHLGQRLLRYHGVALIGMVIQWGGAMGLNYGFLHWFELESLGIWKYISQCMGIGLAMAWNFVTNMYWTWAQTDEELSSDSPQTEQSLDTSPVQ